MPTMCPALTSHQSLYTSNAAYFALRKATFHELTEDVS
jgi:hypothetical protein